MTYELKAYGQTFTVIVKGRKYAENDNLAITLDYYDEDFKTYLPFGAFTVNLEKLPKNQAYVDTNNCEWAEKFIQDNQLGIPLNKTRRSGYCEYPLYLFDTNKLEDYRRI